MKISQGDAELKGFVNCTVFRVVWIGPLRCERSHVILVIHVLSTILLQDMVNRTRVEGGGYSKHDIVTSVEVLVLYLLVV